MTSATSARTSVRQPPSATTTSSEGTTTKSTHRSATSSGVSATKPSVRQPTLTTSTSSWLSAFDTIGATVNADYLSLIDVELFSTNGETARHRTTMSSRKRATTATERQPEENSGDFFDDFLNSRWCDGQRTITPRGGVNKQRPLLPWLKCIKRDAHQRQQQHYNDNNGGNHTTDVTT